VILNIFDSLYNGCRKPGRHIARVTAFYMVVFNVCGSSGKVMLYVTLLVPRIFRWFLTFGKLVEC
jgi:hypothetical protein